MPVEKVSLGQLVKSNAGRDTGQIYLIVGILNPAAVWLADGRSRKAAKPKKKNIRHISVLGTIDNGVAAKIASGKMVTDEEIRQVVNTCMRTGE